MDRKSNLRNMVVTTSSGMNVKNTQMLKGEAKTSAAFNDKNETKEFVSTQPLGKGGGYGGLAEGN